MCVKKIYQLSFVLLLAITLTACTGSKKKIPGADTDGEDTDDIAKNICKEYPTSEYCKVISENTELKLEDAKPIQKDWSATLILYWSDPLYTKGFQIKEGGRMRTNFSIDTDSTLKVGDKVITYRINSKDGSLVGAGTTTTTISSTLGGGTGGFTLSNVSVGDKILVIAVFPNKTYLYLPPLEIIA